MTQIKSDWSSPVWFGELANAFRRGISHAFILHLNVSDYCLPGITVKNFLGRTFAQSRDLIATYNRSEGIAFPYPSIRERAAGEPALSATDVWKMIQGIDDGEGDDDPVNRAIARASGSTVPAGPAALDLPKSPAQAIPALERVLTQNQFRTAVIIDYSEYLFPESALSYLSPEDRTNIVSLERWGTDFRIGSNQNIVILLTGSLTDLNSGLRAASNRWKAIEVPLPDFPTRERFADYLIADFQTPRDDGSTWDVAFDLDARELASLTAGLSLIHIEDLFLRARAEGRLSAGSVRDAKSAIIEGEYRGLLEVIEPSFGFDRVGGMQPLKDWARRELVDPIRRNDVAFIPQNVLLVGPPGTGKTFFVRALAKEVGFNCVALNMENILGGIVSESERNLTRALSIVRSLSPCLLFVDELDQSDVASRGQGSGNPVAKNLFSLMLRFLGDPALRGKVVFFGASNRPDLLDAALLSRLDAIIPVLLGDEDERRKVIAAQFAGYQVPVADDALDLIAKATNKYSSRDLGMITRKAIKVARASNLDAVDRATAQAAVRAIRPGATAKADFFELIAVQNCNDAELLPANYARLLDDREDLKNRVNRSAPDEYRRGTDREL